MLCDFKKIQPCGMLSSSIPIVVYNQRLHIRRHINISFYPTIKSDADPSTRKCTWKNTRLISSRRDWLQAFPFQQFHVLFNSLSKVLFIFPSRYLFTIGLSPIFSFRWNLPPILSCIPKQLDSLRAHHIKYWKSVSKTGFSPSMTLCSKRLVHGPARKALL